MGMMISWIWARISGDESTELMICGYVRLGHRMATDSRLTVPMVFATPIAMKVLSSPASLSTSASMSTLLGSVSSRACASFARRE